MLSKKKLRNAERVKGEAIKDQVQNDMVAAMKSGDALKVSVLRMVLSELNYKKIELQKELTDEDVIGVLNREVKKRREAIAAYRAGGREDSALGEEKELEILSGYLPIQLSEDEIKDQISKIKEIEGMTDYGSIMKIVAPMFKGRADGGLVAQIVKRNLE